MARNPKPKQDNPEQSKRFIETAQALDADDSAAAFERVREGHFRHFSARVSAPTHAAEPIPPAGAVHE